MIGRQLIFASLIFFILLITSSLMIQVFNTEFGTIDYFVNHGYFFLIFITFFPRLTLLFSNVVSGGFLWWLGFFFCPRILVAALATIAYFKTNPLLVVASWIVALSGETAEKLGISKSRSRFHFRVFNAGRPEQFNQHSTIFRDESKRSETKQTIEAEYTVIDKEKF